MYKYNLVLFRHPKYQSDSSDLMTVRNMMIGRAPDIQVHILSGTAPPEFWRKVANRPTLIFSNAAFIRFDGPIRGTRLISQSLTKMEESKLMTAAGIPVPEIRLITPDLRLDEAEWGPFTIIKPNQGIRGQAIRLVRTRDVRWIDTTALPKDDQRHGRELLAQRFIDTGPFSTSYRVMTLLGRPVYCAASIAVAKRPEIHADGADAIELHVAVNDGMERRMALSNDSEIIGLATSLHAELPHLPVMGVDIIREHGTGRLFALEFNSHGLVWHLSSKLGYGMQYNNGIDFYGQFNALGTITDALIEATRERAT